MYRPPTLLDPLSFALGFLAGTLFWFLIGRIRGLWIEMRQQAQERREQEELQRIQSLRARYLRHVARRAQGMHLAAPLFSLEEIVLPPRLLAPPPHAWPGEMPPAMDTVETTLPYLPWWPELGTTFGAPPLSVHSLLFTSSPIALLAPTGYGKTVALAYLALLLAQENESLEEKRGTLPLLFHVSELPLPFEETDFRFELLADALREQCPDLNISELIALIQSAVAEGKAVFLLDGYDELPPEKQQEVSQFLRALRRAVPRLQIITTVSPEQVDGLLSLGFHALALQSWERWRSREFVRRWGELWARQVTTEVWEGVTLPSVDPLLIASWLEGSLEGLSPLELTLKVWGAFAGDMGGLDVRHALAAHLRRLMPPEVPIAAAETLALQSLAALQPYFEQKQARQWLREFEPPEVEATASEEVSQKKKGKKQKQPVRPSLSVIDKFVAGGLLQSRRGGRLTFLHPGLMHFLAAHGLSAYGMQESLAAQPEWSGKWGTLTYLVTESEETALLGALLQEDAPPLYRQRFLLGRTLRLAPPKSAWRKFLAQVGKIFQDESLPCAQRAEAMLALALSRDPGAPTLFRYYLGSASADETLCLAALGSGLVRDEKAVQALISLFLQHSSDKVRTAAALALVNIGSSEALLALARALLQGDETVRRIAAEALANDPLEGHATLRDGLSMEDVMLRRAVVYGLARVQELWAVTLLQQAQMQDDHWIVRNAATAVLEQKTDVRRRLPRPLRPPSETDWLLKFAARKGMGIAPGSPATEILLQVVREGEEEERASALLYLRNASSDAVFSTLYQVLYDPASPLRESVYRLLWEMAWAGEKLPHPQKYGLRA
jgi:hypothetical protein